MTTALTQEQLKKWLHYDPETGLFRWKTCLKPDCTAKIAGSPCNSGRYRRIWIAQTGYYEHYLAWLYVYGEWPPEHVDHINGRGSDNRIVNLRIASRSQNMCNAKLRIDSKTGVKGVTLNPRWVSYPSRKYVAAVVVSKSGGVRKKYRECFPTLAEAEAAVRAARERIHGEFANHG